MTKLFIRSLLLSLTVACSREAATEAPGPASSSPASVYRLGAVRDLGTPQFRGSSKVPFLAPGPDGPLLSWMEEVEPKKHSLRFARLNGESWETPRQIASSADFFVNWADTPSIAQSGDVLFAHWLQKSSSGKYSYDVNVVSSRDQGKSWSKAVVPHRNPVKSEYGFVSLLPEGDGAISMTWLDGRDMKEEGVGDMAIRYARMSADGTLSGELVLDRRTCECCQTGIARTKSGPVIVYRDRSEKELRDVAIVRIADGRATAPALVHGDQWLMPGCPVNGPQIDAVGDDAAVAWFTEAQGKSKVRVAFSNDGGATFTPPNDISITAPLGRVDVVMLDSGTAAVSWLERNGENADVRLQLVNASEVSGRPLTLGSTSAARPSGFPRMVRFRDSLLISWTMPGQRSTIVVKKVELKKI